MMRGPAPFLRIVADLIPLLAPVSTEDRGVQVERIPQGDPRHPFQALAHQRFGNRGESGIGEGEKEAPKRIGRGEVRQAEEPRQQGIAAIPREMSKPFDPQGQTVEPRQQHIRRGDLIVRAFRKRGQGRLETRPQPDEFHVQTQQNGPRPDGNRMVGEGEANFGVEW